MNYDKVLAFMTTATARSADDEQMLTAHTTWADAVSEIDTEFQSGALPDEYMADLIWDAIVITVNHTQWLAEYTPDTTCGIALHDIYSDEVYEDFMALVLFQHIVSADIGTLPDYDYWFDRQTTFYEEEWVFPESECS